MLSDRHRTEELPQINMTPMVDVVLCLLVFFMAATRLYDWDEHEFIVNVPQVAEAAPLTAAPDDLALTILKPGVVAVGESTYELPALADMLRDARERYADQGVIIRGDAALNYQDLADVLSTCDTAGIRNVRLPVRPRTTAADRRALSGLPQEHPHRQEPSMAEFYEILNKLILHLSPQTVNDLAQSVGPWLYVVLFAIIFAETGLVAIPFLPGDSLLFAVGAVAAMDGSPINLTLVAVLLCIAAVVGDAINYTIGYHVGPRIFRSETSWFLNKRHLDEAQLFYEQYGGKTIILARFMPIVRTFAPFVAGIGKMNYASFALFNVVGGVAWVLSFLLAGWWFGGLEVVKKYFHLVIVAIIVISILPAGIEYLRKRRTPVHAPEPAE